MSSELSDGVYVQHVPSLPGCGIDLMCEKAITVAGYLGGITVLSFNGTVVPVYMADTVDELRQRWASARQEGR